MTPHQYFAEHERLRAKCFHPEGIFLAIPENELDESPCRALLDIGDITHGIVALPDKAKVDTLAMSHDVAEKIDRLTDFVTAKQVYADRVANASIRPGIQPSQLRPRKKP